MFPKCFNESLTTSMYPGQFSTALTGAEEATFHNTYTLHCKIRSANTLKTDNNEQNNTIEWTGIDSTQNISLSMEKLRARFFHLMGELFSGEGDILSKTKWKNKS